MKVKMTFSALNKIEHTATKSVETFLVGKYQKWDRLCSGGHITAGAANQGPY